MDLVLEQDSVVVNEAANPEEGDVGDAVRDYGERVRFVRVLR
jgi:hypothetical protein